ncbi:RusA family crossover junction endodeoxyribonuclease [Ekhidna sp.]|uniref:RusA family crossover junction endodeoxyribonuclease n=1 Tax=Ekhidna sp. TaxID=2608089 RepID=UPI003CCBCD56
MLPIEFTFEGPPLSLQSKSKARKSSYKTRVGTAAQNVLPTGFSPLADRLQIVITYYYEGETPDIDNIIKPIQDALIGIVYVDDNQIADTRSRKREIDGSYTVRNVSLPILQAFSNGSEFIHVKIDRHVTTQELD